MAIGWVWLAARRLVLVAVGLALLVGSAPASAVGVADGAQACQEGGWQNLARSDGTRFGNAGECVSYAARGGEFVPSLSMTVTDTIKEVEIDGVTVQYLEILISDITGATPGGALHLESNLGFADFAADPDGTFATDGAFVFGPYCPTDQYGAVWFTLTDLATGGQVTFDGPWDC
jgi:hypothetical protein